MHRKMSPNIYETSTTYQRHTSLHKTWEHPPISSIITPTHFFGGGWVLGLELRAYTLSHSTSPCFEKGIFKIRSRELFALVGFEQRSS
jgi:hypothetical protein